MSGELRPHPYAMEALGPFSADYRPYSLSHEYFVTTLRPTHGFVASSGGSS